jgi:hypothetical protein
VKRQIDWLRVDWVCQGTALPLTPGEKRMVVRRLSDRMLDRNDGYWDRGTIGKLTAAQVAERLCVSERSVQRLRDEMPAATKKPCPVCHETMWILRDTNTVEAHPDRLYEQCPMSGQTLHTRSGLAAVRPDLYGWLEVTV